MKLQDKLSNLNRYPFHMPGHKRNEKFGIVGADIDVTEIDGLDNLHSPTDCLLEIEDKLSTIYHSKKSFLLVNGSTVGILASIFAVCSRGDRIAIARNCHKSVYNACSLLELKVVFIEPDYDSVDGYYTRVSQKSVDTVLNSYPDTRAIVITSPTYEGNVSTISASVPVIIDSAHGAHFGISYFPAYPVGDIVVSSLHKTLPALTQTAVLNVNNTVYIDRVKRFLDIFETSSPSYVLMNSASICADYVLNNRRDFDDFYSRLCDFRCDSLHNLRLKYTDDPSKIVISTANTNITGVELADILRKEYAIEVEMASLSYVVLISTVGDEHSAFDKLKDAFESIDEGLIQCSSEFNTKPPAISDELVISISDNGIPCDLSDAVSKVSNEFVYAYPPDIPILVPNEIITKETIEYIKSSINNGVNIVSDSALLPNKLLTK